MKRRVRTDNGGFTLLEVIIAIAILGFVTVPIMKYFTDSMRYTAQMEKKQKATLAAQESIEYMKAQDRLIERMADGSGNLYYWVPKLAGSDETDTTGLYTAYDISGFSKTDGKGTIVLKRTTADFDTVVTLSTAVSANDVSRPIIYGIDDTKNVMIVEREEEQEALMYFMALNTSYVSSHSGITPFASPSAAPSASPAPSPAATVDPAATPSPAPAPVVVLAKDDIRRLLQREIDIDIDKEPGDGGAYTVKAQYTYSCSGITDAVKEIYKTSYLLDTRIEKLEGLYLLFNITDPVKDKINVTWGTTVPADEKEAMELVLVCQNLDQLASTLGGTPVLPGATPAPTVSPAPAGTPAPTSEPFAFTSDKYNPILNLVGFGGWPGGKLKTRTNIVAAVATDSLGTIVDATGIADPVPLTTSGTPVRLISMDVEIYSAGDHALGNDPLVKMQTTKGE